MSGVSSPRGERAGRPGAGWERVLAPVEAVVPDEETPPPRLNRETRRAIARSNRKGKRNA